jgi:hypothetical protein
VNFDDAAIQKCYELVQAAIQARGGTQSDAFEMARLWTADEDIRSLKSLILFGLRGIAASHRSAGPPLGGGEGLLPKSPRRRGQQRRHSRRPAPPRHGNRPCKPCGHGTA